MVDDSAKRTRLIVRIGSFSYKKGLPVEESTHGGGFIFDCRCVPNPGRHEQYKALTGRDSSVKEFLEREPDVEQFYGNVLQLVVHAVTRYLERGFELLIVRFGCTGGQHRSVYFSERLARDLTARFPVDVSLEHRDMPTSGAAS